MKTIVNFRDLGGLTGHNGQKVKAKRLLRSADLVDLHPEDKSRLLEEFGLKQIVDFRSTPEVASRPNDHFEGVTSHVINVLKDTEENMASQEGMTKHLDPAKADYFMEQVNRQLISLDSAINGYRQFFKACLSVEDGATLFHCAAGKDRTGFGAALLLKTLGVSDEEIFADYLKTIEMRAAANEAMVEAYRAKGLNDSQLEALKAFYSVKPEYLKAAFSEIADKFGSFEGYLENGLQINEDEVAKLRELYLEAG
ncbi:MAG: tyrosine-protein phosphatase [Turicibacter sp.]|nr:tyrosine-protein phosphatase [Turicibacter sp.]